MEVYKRKILLESLTDRSEGVGYGTITADTLEINFFLKQTIDDMGMFTDYPSYNEPILYPLNNNGNPNYLNPLVGKLIDSGITFNFMTEPIVVPDVRVVSDYYYYGGKISASTNSRLIELRKYDDDEPYEEMFLFNNREYINYLGNNISGVTTIVNMLGNGEVVYSFDAENDADIGTENQTTGLLLKDLNETITTTYDEVNLVRTSRVADIIYNGEGWNETNISLSGNLKQEEFIGITSQPEVQSEVFIERGVNSVLESHLRLSEIKSLEHLENYSNGSYYNINKQKV